MGEDRRKPAFLQPRQALILAEPESPEGLGAVRK